MATSSRDTSDEIFRGEYYTTARMNLQHFFWWRQQGYLLHPSIVVGAPPAGLRIADLGTGTGIWATDVATTIPNVRVDGFDIDLSKTPPVQWIPENVRFRRLNVLEELPRELVGVYDVVAIRLMVTVVRDNDPSQILRLAKQMLKPGGWLQWSDIDPSSHHIVKVHPSLRSAMNEELMEGMTLGSGLNMPTWVASLATSVKGQGFDAVVEQKARSDDHIRHYEQDNYFMAFDELSLDRLQGKALAEYHDRVTKAHQEVVSGVSKDLDKITVIGRKPR